MPIENSQNLLNQTNAATGLNNPSLAVGVGGVVDWNDTIMFLDLVKMTRGWTAFVDGEYHFNGELREMGYFEDSLDENGWPTYFPDHIDNFSTIWAWERDDQFAEAINEQRAGTFVLRYEGEGELQISGVEINIISQEQGEIVFENPNGQTFFMNINSTDPNGTGDYIRNVIIVNEEHLELYESGAVFHPDYLEAYSDLRELRAMDMMETNHSHVVNIEDRPMLNDMTYMGGVPIELIVELANQAGTDLWINIPHLASDEYIEFLATYVHDNLDPNLKVTVEYSNEIWNTLFEQSSDLHNLGVEAFPDAGDGYDVRLNYQGMRTMETMKIFTEVFGVDGADRLIRVAGSMADNPWVTEQILNAPLWQQADPDNYEPPHTYFDAIAVTTYFGGAIVTNPDYLQAVQFAIFDPETNEYDLLRDMLLDPTVDSSIPQLAEGLAAQAALMDLYNLRLISYEGGQHVHHLAGTSGDGRSIEAFMREFVRSEQMGELYEELIALWNQYGDGPFMNFGWVGAPGDYGSWAAKATYDDTNPRTDVLENYNENNIVDWESRGGEHFQQGVTEMGTVSNDTLIGTSQEDFLLGGEGDDILVGGSGNDGLHGGSGNDIALFRGTRADYNVTEETDGYRVVGLDGSDRIVDVEFIEFADGERFELATMTLGEVNSEPQSIKNYIFGHSLIFNVPTPESGIEDSIGMKVPYWLHEFAEEAGNDYSFSGQYGFFPGTTPGAQWGLEGFSAWDDDSPLTFAEVDFDSITMTVANFVQYLSPTEPLDGENPNNDTAVSLTLESIDAVTTLEPGVKIYIYENWPDMGGFVSDQDNFNPTDEEFANYNDYTLNGFQDWWNEYVSELQTARPDVEIVKIPVGSVIAQMLTDPDLGLDQIPVTELYYDNAPHGTDTIYFLASIINYTTLYGELPPTTYNIPDTVHPIVRGNYNDIIEFVGNELQVNSNGEDPVIEENIVNGTDDNDYLVGQSEVDIINAGAGDDLVYGLEGNDTLNGDTGNDRLMGHEGNDTISGGIGSDVLYGYQNNDILYGGEGDDYLYGDNKSGANDYVDGGDDEVHGGEGNDRIIGGVGNDTLNGDEGVDVLYGNAGDDILNGGDDLDYLYGGNGGDTLNGGAGDDQLRGENGNDTINGDNGSDTLYGGDGDDILVGGSGRDYLNGNAGADTFFLDLESVDRVRDFNQSQGDTLNIADLLTGFDSSTNDVNDFVDIVTRSANRTDIRVNTDGQGNDFQYVGIIYGDLTGETVNTLMTSGSLIVE